MSTPGDMEIPSIIQEPNHVWKLWLPRAVAVREGRKDGTAVSSGASATARTRRPCAAQLRQFALPVRRSCLAQSSIESHSLKVEDVLIIGELPPELRKVWPLRLLPAPLFRKRELCHSSACYQCVYVCRAMAISKPSFSYRLRKDTFLMPERQQNYFAITAQNLYFSY